jgi:hypothetical protein
MTNQFYPDWPPAEAAGLKSTASTDLEHHSLETGNKPVIAFVVKTTNEAASPRFGEGCPQIIGASPCRQVYRADPDKPPTSVTAAP